MIIALELLPERQCSKCTEIKKKAWGCETKALQSVEIDGVRLDRCPRRPLLDDPSHYVDLFWLYRAYQKGYLPENGGLQDQPAKLMDCFRIIDRALDFCKDAQSEQKQG